MLKLKVWILASLIALYAATACLPTAPIQSPLATEEPGIPVTGAAVVQSVNVQILEFQPLQAQVIVSGQLPDSGCSTISTVDQVREGNTFKVNMVVMTDPVADCTLAATPFEQVIPLDVRDLQPARYSVNVNGVENSFELLSRDVFQFQQMLVGALNARNYDLLQVLMGGSLMIADWQSTGTTYAPDLAVEQVRSNLLPATSQVLANPSKNLIELLGADPIRMVGPGVVGASPLFVSGWGTEGKGESILFIARQPDGGLYWQGLVFAKDGFKPAILSPVSLPVDVGVYGASIPSITPQRDLVIYNGPASNFRMIGNLFAGQPAQVTGTNESGNWLRVMCPDGRADGCWVQADPGLISPAAPPQILPPAANPSPIPTITILAVTRDDQVTILAQDYPDDTEFQVRMGEIGTNGIHGFVVDRFNSGNGGTFMLTFDIPEKMHGEKQIAIRLESENGYYSYNWFDNANTGTIANTTSPQFTSANYIVTKKDVTIYSGPSKNNPVIGSIDKGQRIKVTGMSADGGWWQVMCPDGTAGSCWVSAKSKFTSPSA